MRRRAAGPGDGQGEGAGRRGAAGGYGQCGVTRSHWGGIECSGRARGKAFHRKVDRSGETSCRRYGSSVSRAVSLCNRLRSRRSGHRVIRISACAELEVRNLGAPVEASCRLQILGGVPERAVVHRVDAKAAVVAPPGEAAVLGAAAGLDVDLRAERAQGIRGSAAGEADRGIEAARGNAVTDGDVTGVVHCGATHPAEARVGSECALLENRGRAAGASNFIPPDTYARTGRDGMVHHQRLVVAKVAVSQPVHETVRQRIKLLV